MKPTAVNDSSTSPEASVPTSQQHNQHRFQSYVYSFAFGSKGSGDGEFDSPFGIAVSPSGNVVVTDAGNARIQVFDQSGKFLTAFGSSFLLFQEKTLGDGKFFFPKGVAISSLGEIVVADTVNHRIQIFDGDGKFLRKFGNKGRGNGNMKEPSAIAITSSGNFAVADAKNYRIQVFSTEGKFSDQFGNEGDGDGQFFLLWGVAVTSSGNFIVSDCHRIQVFDSHGTFLRKFGDGGEGTFTTGVALTSSDNVVVAYMGKFNGIRLFDLEGKLLTEFGRKGSDNGQFNEPSGVAVDCSGNIFVADKGNHRIQVFKPTEKTE